MIVHGLTFPDDTHSDVRIGPGVSDLFGSVRSCAVFSESSGDDWNGPLYRYALWRHWNPDLPYCGFIGLNPSTADHFRDDPTMRRVIQFAKDWGFGGVVMLNLYAFRSRIPGQLVYPDDPVGPENDLWITTLLPQCGRAVCAWGDYLPTAGRAEHVRAMIPRPHYALGFAKSGHPRHPLYLPQNIELREWNG